MSASSTWADGTRTSARAGRAASSPPGSRSSGAASQPSPTSRVLHGRTRWWWSSANSGAPSARTAIAAPTMATARCSGCSAAAFAAAGSPAIKSPCGRRRFSRTETTRCSMNTAACWAGSWRGCTGSRRRSSGGFSPARSCAMLLWSSLALAGHRLADDFRQPQRGGAGVLPVCEDEIELGEELAAFAHGQRLQRAGRQLLADPFFRQPRKSIARACRLDRGGEMAERPALRRLHRRSAGALGTRLAHHEVPIRPQVAQRELAAELVQRMLGMRDEDEAQPHQRLAEEAGRNAGEDGEVGLALLERRRLVEEVARSPVQQLAGRRELGLAAGDLERLHAELGLELLHPVGHRRLALVEGCRGLGVAALVDDRDQGAPLVEGNAGLGHLTSY